MSKFAARSIWLAIALSVAVPASADEIDDFVADQNRLAALYLEAGDPIAAVAPLLNVLRRTGNADRDGVYEAKLNLGRAYAALGLYRSVHAIVAALESAPEPWRSESQVLDVELELARGNPERALAALQDYRAAVTHEAEPELFFRVAKACFAARVTSGVGEAFAEIEKTGDAPEAVYFTGVLELMAGDLEGAYERFTKLQSTLSRKRNPALYDSIQLALGRIYYEAGDYAAAERFYGAVPESSPEYDQALYETAWVYVAEGDLVAASGGLLRLAIDYPFSPLVPRAQVVYGYLMLRRGEFNAAERAFASYVAHYSALSDHIAELDEQSDPRRLYDTLFENIDRSISEGRSLVIELVAWLNRSPRLHRARELTRLLRRSENELADLTRVLRDVQSIAESGPQGFGGVVLPAEDEKQIMRLETAIRDAERAIDAKMLPVGRRLTGSVGVAFEKTQGQLEEVRKMSLELERLRRRNADKRREVVSLLQYADASQWGIWADDDTLAASPVTDPPSLRTGRVDRIFVRLDRSEDALARAARKVRRIEREVLYTRLTLLENELPPKQIAQLRKRHANLIANEEKLLDLRGERQARRRTVALSSRARVNAFISAVGGLRERLLALSEESIHLRGEIARTELGEVEDHISELLVHARLGNADVAWEARQSARERARRVRLREQQDMAALRQFYGELGKMERKPESAEPWPVTSSTMQRAARLAARADAYRAGLEQVDDIFTRQGAASAALAARLRSEGYQEEAVERLDAAGLLVDEPAAEQGKILGYLLQIDGRPVSPAGGGFAVDSFLEPGSHQIDAVVVVEGADGKLRRMAGSFLVTLERARGYRVAIVGADQGELRFVLRKEGQ